MWFLKWLTEGEWFFAKIFKLIFWLLFGKEFFNESLQKQKKSLQNLVDFSQNEEFPLKDNKEISKQNLSKLKPKDLEKFYKYLDSKDIDYSTETFWQELLTWKTKDTKFLEVYNLWVGRGVSVLEMVEVAKRVTWRQIPYEIVDRRPWDLAEVYCNPEKAKKELNWESKTSLEDSLKNSWKFYNK